MHKKLRIDSLIRKLMLFFPLFQDDDVSNHALASNKYATDQIFVISILINRGTPDHDINKR